MLSRVSSLVMQIMWFPFYWPLNWRWHYYISRIFCFLIKKRFFVKNYLWFSPPETIFLFNEIVFLMVKDCLQSNNTTNSISVYDIHAKVLIRWFIYRGIPPWNTKNQSLPNQHKTICKWLVIIFSINGYTSNQLYINILF